MNARLLFAALAVPCLCAAAESAIGQDRSTYGPVDKAQSATPLREAERDPQRLPTLDLREEQRRIEMIESWQVGKRAEFGLGRFRVGEIARAPTHTERVRDDLMARDNKAIAGAGLRIRFD